MLTAATDSAGFLDRMEPINGAKNTAARMVNMGYRLKTFDSYRAPVLPPL